MQCSPCRIGIYDPLLERLIAAAVGDSDKGLQYYNGRVDKASLVSHDGIFPVTSIEEARHDGIVEQKGCHLTYSREPIKTRECKETTNTVSSWALLCAEAINHGQVLW